MHSSNVASVYPVHAQIIVVVLSLNMREGKIPCIDNMSSENYEIIVTNRKGNITYNPAFLCDPFT